MTSKPMLPVLPQLVRRSALPERGLKEEKRFTDALHFAGRFNVSGSFGLRGDSAGQSRVCRNRFTD